MQTREKMLAGALAGVIGVWFGLHLLESTFFEPLKALESKEEGLVGTVEAK